MKEIKTMTTAEMIAEYNQITGKSITKFSSRAAGEKQLAQKRRAQELLGDIREVSQPESDPLLDSFINETMADDAGCPHCGAQLSQTYANDDETRLFCHYCSTEYWANSRKIYKAPKSSDSRSEGIRQSWKNKTVRAARCERNNVKIDGVLYKSVPSAFRFLGLPMSKMVKFRLTLKAYGKAEFNGKWFELVA